MRVAKPPPPPPCRKLKCSNVFVPDEQARMQVIAVSRGDYYDAADKLGAEFFNDVDDFAEQHPDVVVLASSILSTRAVLDNLPLQRFRRSTLFVDVLSVKVFPKQLLLSKLPPSMDILCTHPMFGPDSGKESWRGLNFQFERVRTGSKKQSQQRMETFLHVRPPRCKCHSLSTAKCALVL